MSVDRSGLIYHDGSAMYFAMWPTVLPIRPLALRYKDQRPWLADRAEKLSSVVENSCVVKIQNFDGVVQS